MSKFSGAKARTHAPSVIASSSVTMPTHEGGAGFGRDDKSELFLLAVSNMVGEDTFYEGAGERDARFRALVAACATADHAWTASLIGWLRTGALMRSASVVAAAEYVKSGAPGGRFVVASALQRPDEPGEIVGYWRSRYGRRMPKPLKRGIADACRRLYTESALLKYDGQSKGVRFADVLDLCHVKPKAPWQSHLFRAALDLRHKRAEPVIHESLAMVRAARALEALPAEARRAALLEAGPEKMGQAGFTWERLAGWLPGGMDSEAWESIVPSMGVMALLRNLRNFDQAGVSDTVADAIRAKLTSADDVKASRVLPLRFLSALRAVSSLRWGDALERGIALTLGNVPALPGRTLVLVDGSGSMSATMSGKSGLSCADAASLFGAALVQRNPGSVAYRYSSQLDAVANHAPGTSVLLIARGLAQYGGATKTWPCMADALTREGNVARVVIITDEQAHPSEVDPRAFPLPIYVFNIAGYQPASMEHGAAGRYCIGGGLTDAAYAMLATLDGARDGRWPWEQSP